jgi:predicted ribonuclease YlaK
MNRYKSLVVTLYIMSHITNRSTTTLKTLLNTAGPTTNIVLMQEVNVKDPRYATTHPDFLLLLPPHVHHKVTSTDLI